MVVPPKEQCEESPFRDRIVTVPNVICAFRLVGSMALFGVALIGDARLFSLVFGMLSASDWIDGRLARWLNQRSVFGARFDSVADFMMYSSLFFGIGWLKMDVLTAEWLCWIPALLSYVLTTSAGLWKYGRVPSYHTRGAKISYGFILVGALSLLLDYSLWPFRAAMLSVTLTNLEATALTWYLPEWRADVPGLLQAVRERRH